MQVDGFKNYICIMKQTHASVFLSADFHLSQEKIRIPFSADEKLLIFKQNLITYEIKL
jgi:hypothetical protein